VGGDMANELLAELGAIALARLGERLEHKLDMVLTQQGQILAALASQREEMIKMSKELDDLTSQVQKNTDVEASAVTLIQGLAAQIAAQANDPAAIKALTAKLSGSADALAAAIVANTPAATQPVA
jgi:ABC-type transporter Mla subunit MlaD